jgi:hypothetical protein
MSERGYSGSDPETGRKVEHSACCSWPVSEPQTGNRFPRQWDRRWTISQYLQVTDDFTREGQGTNASRWITSTGRKAVRYLVVNYAKNRSSLCMSNRAELEPALCVITVKKSILMPVTANLAHHGRTVTQKQSSHDPQKNYRAENVLIWRGNSVSCSNDTAMPKTAGTQTVSLNRPTPIENSTNWDTENHVLASEQVDRSAESKT